MGEFLSAVQTIGSGAAIGALIVVLRLSVLFGRLSERFDQVWDDYEERRASAMHHQARGEV